MKTNVLLLGLIGIFLSCSSPTDKDSGNQKKDEKDANPEALSEKTQEKSKSSKLNKQVSLECLEKTYSSQDEQEYIHYKFKITNKTEKDVQLLKGKITFTNKKGHVMKSFPMAYGHLIKAGENTIWDTKTTFDQFMDEEEALKNFELKKLDCRWTPVQITFSDGTTME